MTVEQLITALKKMPLDADVVVPLKETSKTDEWDVRIESVEFNESNGVVELFTEPAVVA